MTGILSRKGFGRYSGNLRRPRREQAPCSLEGQNLHWRKCEKAARTMRAAFWLGG